MIAVEMGFKLQTLLEGNSEVAFGCSIFFVILFAVKSVCSQ